MKLIPILAIIINIPPILLHTLFICDIFLFIQVHISLFPHLLLQHILWYLFNITQTIKQYNIPISNIQGSSTSVSPSIINNSPFSLSGRFYFGSSISTCSFRNKNWSKEELISFFLPSLYFTNNLFLPNIAWTYPTTYLLILLIHTYLVFSSISPTFAFTTDSTPKCCVDLILLLHLLYNFDNRLAHGGLRLRESLVISVANSECAVDFSCLKINSN